MTDLVPLVAGLSTLAPTYGALLCDVWGVVHNGEHAHAAASHALARFRGERGPVVLVTNAPRPASEVARQLDQLGTPRQAWDAIVTSGDVTRELLGQWRDKPLHWVGPERDSALFDGLSLNLVADEQAEALVVTDLNRDDETPEDYRERLADWRERNLPMVCANPDLVVERGDRLIYCGGSLADAYERAGGEVIMAGKPFGPIYAAALQEIERTARTPVPAAMILAVGDAVRTDVAGAARVGIDLLFISDSIHGAELGPQGVSDPAAVSQLLAPAGASVVGFMPALAWA